MRLEGSELWAWVTEVGGEESLVGAELPGMGQVPLVFCRRKLAEGMEPLARLHADASGQPVALRRYEAREEMRLYSPGYVSAEPPTTFGPGD